MVWEVGSLVHPVICVFSFVVVFHEGLPEINMIWLPCLTALLTAIKAPMFRLFLDKTRASRAYAMPTHRQQGERTMLTILSNQARDENEVKREREREDVVRRCEPFFGHSSTFTLQVSLGGDSLQQGTLNFGSHTQCEAGKRGTYEAAGRRTVFIAADVPLSRLILTPPQ